MKISIVIPTLDEEAALPRLLPQLLNGEDEVIIVDGGSTDSTVEAARRFPVRVISGGRGRAVQMNAGAAQATGQVLWFLHADSQPPAAWRDQIVRALADPSVVGGSFRVRIDAAGIGYRFLDGWGRIRPFLQRNFYGDQGIFVRRSIFESLGGFPQRPALEDVDFSSRLWRAGKVVMLPGPLKTSARRWETHGFLRTVLTHTRMALSFRPVSPSPRLPVSVVILAKAPVPGQVKTRLVPPLTPEQAADLAKQLLQGTVKLVAGLSGVKEIVAVAPDDGIDQVRGLLAGTVPEGDCPLRFIPQGDGDFGNRISHAFEETFTRGAKGVIVLGADHPNLPSEYLARAVKTLQQEADPVVLGPTEDGGYYLIGLTRLHPELLQDIPWSTSQVLQATLEKAKATGLSVTLLPPWYDIDRPEDLHRLPARYRLEVK